MTPYDSMINDQMEAHFNPEPDSEPIYTVDDVAYQLGRHRTGIQAKIKRRKLGTVIDGRLYLSEQDVVELKKPSPLVRANQDDDKRVADLIAEMRRKPQVWARLLKGMQGQ